MDSQDKINLFIFLFNSKKSKTKQSIIDRIGFFGFFDSSSI
jgi:hypothetical protein